MDALNPDAGYIVDNDEGEISDSSRLSRRAVAKFGVAGVYAATVGRVMAAPYGSDASSLTPDQAISELMAGNARFVAGAPIAHLQDLNIVRARAAEGQWPIAGVLSCADSRVPVEMAFDEPMGRLFVTRIAGNVTTPEIVASLEYGVAVLGIKAIVVMGHSSCGAVKAAMQNADVPGQISALFPSLLPAVYMSKSNVPDVVARTNATIQAATLINASPVIEQKIKAGTLKVVPALYDVATGKIEPLPIPDALRIGK